MEQIELISEDILQDDINLNHVSSEIEAEIMEEYRRQFVIHPIYTRRLSQAEAMEVDSMIRLLCLRNCTYAEVQKLNRLAGATTILICNN